MISKTVTIIAALLLLTSGVMAQDESNCVVCHQSFEDEDGPSYRFSRDVHAQKGLGCVDCHGGDPTLDDMDAVRETADWRGVPDHTGVPQFCARCHSDAQYMGEHNPSLPTDQLQKYKTSVHGQLLHEENDTKVANCVSCHTSHQIADEELPFSSTHPLNLPSTCGQCHADEEYMAEYGIPTDQLAGFKESVHGHALLDQKDLAAPACNDCHGNHGASPPGVNSVSAVCGTCHAIHAELFRESPHDAAFEAMGYPMCETCHGNHRITKPNDQMVGTDDEATCTDCHSADDGTRGFPVADSMKTAIVNLRQAIDTAREVLNEAEAKGMMTRDEVLRIKDAREALIHVRTLVHSFRADTVGQKAAEGIAIADTVKSNSASLIDEYYFRRKGLALASVFITIVAVALYIRIRRLPPSEPHKESKSA